MGAVVEQIQQTYELQVNGYYSQLHLVEDYILKEKEVSPETDANQNFFEAWEKEAGSRLVFISIPYLQRKSNDSRWNEDAD
mgnify:CR=1 FL=1